MDAEIEKEQQIKREVYERQPSCNERARCGQRVTHACRRQCVVDVLELCYRQSIEQPQDAVILVIKSSVCVSVDLIRILGLHSHSPSYRRLHKHEGFD